MTSAAAPTAAAAAPPKRSFPVWAAILIAVLVLALIGGAVAFFVLLPMKRVATVSSADPGSLGFDAEPFDSNTIPASANASAGVESSATSEPVTTNPEPPAEPAPSAPAAAPAASALTQEDAIDTVGRMLDAMRRKKQSEALALVTKNMLADVSNDKTWFSPGPDVLISFEVQDATAKGDTMKVRVLEQWNSGPEKTTYVVVMTDTDGPKVDGIKWSSW